MSALSRAALKFAFVSADGMFQIDFNRRRLLNQSPPSNRAGFEIGLVTTSVNGFGLEQAVIRFGQGIAIEIPDASDGGCDFGACQRLCVLNR